jgi:hypothetical protein
LAEDELFARIADQSMPQLPSSRRKGLSLFLCLHLARFAQQPQLPPNYPRAQYDESRVPHYAHYNHYNQYTLPDPLVLLNRKKVTRVKTWQKSAAAKFWDYSRLRYTGAP